MKTKLYLLGIFFSLLGLLACNEQVTTDFAKEVTTNSQKPNIVIFYVDDLGYGDLSSYGATSVSTPNIDALAQDGNRFTDAHSSASTCTPSRFSLLTGRYAFRNKAAILPGGAPLIIDHTKSTLPKVSKKAGYKTAVVGKWHLGLGDGFVDWNKAVKPGPIELGFDYSFLLPATGDRVPTVYLENHHVVGLDPSDPIKVSYAENISDRPLGTEAPELLKMGADLQHSATIVNGISRIGWMSGGKSAEWIDEDFPFVFTDKAKTFIQESKDEPFMLFFPFSDIHVPRAPNKMFVGKTSMGRRGGAIVQMDWMTGQIVDELKKLGLYDNSHGQPPNGYFSPYKNKRLTDGEKGEYLTERLTTEAINIIDEIAKKSAPFFLYLSFYTVHTQLQAPKETIEHYQTKSDKTNTQDSFKNEEQIWPTDEPRLVRVKQNHPTYASMISKMDTQVGHILQKLNTEGLADNTIVVFTSDNGGLSTLEGSPTSNLQLRGGKGGLYEGRIRVPYIIKLPGVKPQNFDIPVVSTDFYPTLLEAAGILIQPEQHQDGVSLTPLLANSGKLAARPTFLHYPHYSNQGGFPDTAVRLGDWKLLDRYEDGQLQLFNITKDISEQNDLVKEEAAKTAELKALLHQWYKEVDAKFLQDKNGVQPWSNRLTTRLLKDSSFNDHS